MSNLGEKQRKTERRFSICPNFVKNEGKSHVVIWGCSMTYTL